MPLTESPPAPGIVLDRIVLTLRISPEMSDQRQELALATIDQMRVKAKVRAVTEKYLSGLRNLGGIAVEVMFEPIFVRQPLCEDAVLHMRGLGYCLHDFRMLARYPSAKLHYGNTVFVGMN